MTDFPPTSHDTCPVGIRRATTPDADAIAAIHVRSWVATYERPPSDRGLDTDIAHRTEVWRHRLDQQDRLDQQNIGRKILVASLDGAVAGFIYFGPSPDVQDDPRKTGQIFSVHVEPAVTGRGVGRHLMKGAIDELRADGCTTATLWVLMSNQESRGFYETLGWRTDGKQRWEELAVEGEQGEQVEVVRYHLELLPEDRLST